MKKTNILSSLSICALAAGASLALLTGCQHTRTVVRAAQTNTVPVVTSNAVPVVTESAVVRTALNPIAGEPELRFTNVVTVTNIAWKTETNFLRVITPEVAYTNVSLNPAVATAVQVGGEFAPVPWANTAVSIFGIVSGGVFGWINNRRRKAALGEAQTWQDTATVLVQNVEAVRKEAMKIPGYTPEIDLKVIRGLEAAQRIAGVKPQVAALVEEHTEDSFPA